MSKVAMDPIFQIFTIPSRSIESSHTLESLDRAVS